MIPSTRASVGVGVTVTNDAGHILLGYRKKAGEKPSWSLPGGHVEAGESIEAAAIREVAEETGISTLLQVTPCTLLFRTAAPDVELTIAVTARVSVHHEVAIVTETHIFECWRWFDKSDIPVELFPATAGILSLLLRDKAADGWHAYRFC